MSCRLLKTDNCEPAVRISNGGYSHAVVTQTVKEYLACSLQLIAFIFLPLSLTTATDPSHLFRMTINVSLIMAADPLLIFRMTPNGNHMLRLLTHS